MAAPKRTGLGRGISALIPTVDPASARPVDVFFPDSGLPGTNGNGNGNGNGHANGNGAASGSADGDGTPG